MMRGDRGRHVFCWCDHVVMYAGECNCLYYREEAILEARLHFMV